MAVMMYYMWAMSHHPCHNEYVNSSQPAPIVNATEADCYQMMMIVNGLSLRNLLLFIFCTPCQVSLDRVAHVVR